MFDTYITILTLEPGSNETEKHRQHFHFNYRNSQMTILKIAWYSRLALYELVQEMSGLSQAIYLNTFKPNTKNVNLGWIELIHIDKIPHPETCQMMPDWWIDSWNPKPCCAEYFHWVIITTKYGQSLSNIMLAIHKMYSLLHFYW